MTRDLTIQFARPDDLTQIVAFGYRSLAESELPQEHLKPDQNTVLAKVFNLITHGVTLVKRNDANDAKIDGVICFDYTTPWWSNEIALYCNLFYLLEAQRTFRHAKALLDAAKKFANQQNNPIIVDLIGKKDIERKRKLLKVCGFQDAGSVFIYHPK